MSIDELLHELKIVAEAATRVKVSHDKVAVSCGISVTYLTKIRAGSRVPKDNKELFQKLILAYRQEMRNKKIEIEKVLGK